MDYTFQNQYNRGVTWTFKETMVLLDIWGEEEVQNKLLHTLRNQDVFEYIAFNLNKRIGVVRSGDQCRTRMKRLKKEYSRTKLEGKKAANFQFYNIIDNIMKRRVWRENEGEEEEEDGEESEECSNNGNISTETASKHEEDVHGNVLFVKVKDELSEDCTDLVSDGQAEVLSGVKSGLKGFLNSRIRSELSQDKTRVSPYPTRSRGKMFIRRMGGTQQVGEETHVPEDAPSVSPLIESSYKEAGTSAVEALDRLVSAFVEMEEKRFQHELVLQEKRMEQDERRLQVMAEIEEKRRTQENETRIQLMKMQTDMFETLCKTVVEETRRLNKHMPDNSFHSRFQNKQDGRS